MSGFCGNGGRKVALVPGERPGPADSQGSTPSTGAQYFQYTNIEAVQLYHIVYMLYRYKHICCKDTSM